MEYNVNRNVVNSTKLKRILQYSIYFKQYDICYSQFKIKENPEFAKRK